MSSSSSSSRTRKTTDETPRTRKTAEDRRAEIVRTAGTIALADGLEYVTLRRVADELGVRPGLIGHYFPVAEELVAAAFVATASAEIDELLPAGDDTPLDRFRAFFAAAIGELFDDLSRLWLNVRHLCRYRPVLREAVLVVQADWERRVAGLIAEGVAAGQFTAADPVAAAMRILVAIDGVNSYVNLGPIDAELSAVAVSVAERELGLPAGTL